MSEYDPSPAPVGEQTDTFYDSIIKLLNENNGEVSIQDIHNTVLQYKTYQQTYYAVQGILSTRRLSKRGRKITYGYDYEWLPDWLKNGEFEKWAATLDPEELEKIRKIDQYAVKKNVRQHLLRLFL